MRHEREIARLARLNPAKIAEVISDQNLLRERAEIHYAVDSHELIDFCFPVNPSGRGHQFAQPIEEIADDQTSLYDLFFASKNRAILVPEYADEVRSFLGYLEVSLDKVYSEVELLDELTSKANLEDLAGNEDFLALLRKVEKHLSVVIAVSIGIFSLGVGRLRDLMNRRLSFEVPERVEKSVRQVFQGYKSSKLKWEIFDFLQEIALDSARRRGGGSEEEEERLRKANLADAGAIDRIFFLNSALEDLYNRGEAKSRHVVLYLSSARRTARLFKTGFIQEFIPKINGKRYSVLRSREQLFASVAFRGRGKSRREVSTNTIANLWRAKRVVEEVEKLRSVFSGHDAHCQSCILKGGDNNSCRRIRFCRNVEDLQKRIIDPGEEAVSNLSLVSAVRNYRELLSSVPDRETHKDYIGFLREVIGASQRLGSAAGTRLEKLQEIIVLKTSFARMIPEALDSSRIEGLGRRDAVTGIAQYLPTKPRIRDREYTNIIELIVEYYRDSVGNGERILEAYERFGRLDSEMRELAAEHELVRCFLYLAFPKQEGDSQAVEHGRRMIGEHPEKAQEYRYVICWALRRVKRYPEARVEIERALSLYPKDPRFYHAMCLNIFSWLSDKAARALCPYSLGEAIEAAERARDLYDALGDDFLDVAAACSNNVAFLLVSQPKLTQEVVEKSREALEDVKDRVPKKEWHPYYPEYFHTEASVEWAEYKMGRDAGWERKRMREKLKHGLREIRQALRIRPKSGYSELEELFLKELSNV